MDRRKFFKLSAATLLAAQAAQLTALAGVRKSAPDAGAEEFPRPDVTCENVAAGPEDLGVLFLGTGAAGWATDHTRRRHSSVLLDGKVLIDLTVSALDLIPQGCKPEAVFYTHSHGDHYSAKVAVQQGIRRVYLSETWLERAREDFRKAGEATGLPLPQIIPLKVGVKVSEQGLDFTPLPANHATSDYSEQALIYLVEKGTSADRLGVRLLYATDTGGLMGIATRLAGIDSHLKPGRPVTAFVMEATVGIGMEEDFRIFNHSCVDVVAKTVHMLIKTGRYLPPAGQPAYTTHMSRTGWPAHDELVKVIPSPLRPAYDGLFVAFRAVS